MTSDRDAFALIDESASVLRVRNGGFDRCVLVTPASLAAAYGVTPAQYRDYAALRGDPSDNRRGVPGFGSAAGSALPLLTGPARWSFSSQRAGLDSPGGMPRLVGGSDALRRALLDLAHDAAVVCMRRITRRS